MFCPEKQQQLLKEIETSTLACDAYVADDYMELVEVTFFINLLISFPKFYSSLKFLKEIHTHIHMYGIFVIILLYLILLYCINFFYIFCLYYIIDFLQRLR